MSWYIDTSVIGKGDGSQAHWTTVHKPGSNVPVSGIYRCLGCKREVASNANDPFPSQNHHQHDPGQDGSIRWKLNVRADTKG